MMKIKLPNGLYLTAEQNTDPDYSYELFIGITDENDRWLQDIATVRNAYHYEDGEVKWEDRMEALVYEDEENEDYTHSFKINFWKGAE